MTTRYNYKWKKPEKISTPYKEDFEYITIIEPISYNEEDKKTIKEYKEVFSYKVTKSKWSDFIKSFDIGTPSEQILNHIKKGTPLLTAHTLPAGDYTSDALLKGAEIKREMASKNLTLDMIIDAVSEKLKEDKKPLESEANANG